MAWTSSKFSSGYRPVATYIGQVRPWPYHIYGELELENVQKVGVVVITTQYGRTISKLLATVLIEFFMHPCLLHVTCTSSKFDFGSMHCM